MIPGPYSLCKISYESEDSDSLVYTTLSYGYDTASQAYAERAKIASEAGIPEDDVCVIRQIDPEESAEFTD